MNKKMYRRKWMLVVLTVLLSATTWVGCGSKKRKIRKLENFNSEIWMTDKNGCAGTRMELKDNLLKSKHFMRGLKAEQIEDYLGKPDAQDLRSRSQQYYIYFLDPGPKCENAREHPQALLVRFSAVGIANEFTIQAVQ
jgi:hypothetical protein